MVIAALGMAGSDCELLRTGWLAQPVNAASSVAFVLAGMCVWWRGRQQRLHPGAVGVAGLALAAVGAGSIAYHGPQPDWAPAVHDGSIAALALIAVALVAAGVRGAQRAAARSHWRIAPAWMAAAVVAYAAGRSASPWCVPTSPLQFHAIWHALSAVAIAQGLLGCTVAVSPPPEERAVRP